MFSFGVRAQTEMHVMLKVVSSEKNVSIKYKVIVE